MNDCCHTSNILQHITGDVYLCKLCFMHSWRHRWRQQVTEYVKYLNCYISINISARASAKSSKYRKCSWLSWWYIQLQLLFPTKKFVATSNLNYQIQLQSSFFMVMTSLMTFQGGLKVGPFIFFINKMRIFFMITKTWTEILSLNFLYLGIMGLWLYLFKSVLMTSLMTSSGHKVGHIFILPYLHQCFS